MPHVWGEAAASTSQPNSRPSKAVLTHSESCQTTETNKHQRYLNRSPTAGHLLLLAASAPDDDER